MTWKAWRDRFVYLAMSLFVIWHATAVVIAPAPYGSPPVDALHDLFRPYFTLFRLESPWSFFPNIVRLPQFRYAIEGADGTEHSFVPVDAFNWYHPRRNWFERIYWTIMMSNDPKKPGDYYIASLCREHAELNPVAIKYLAVTGGEFQPGDLLAGHQPLDPEFVTVNLLMRAPCPK